LSDRISRLSAKLYEAPTLNMPILLNTSFNENEPIVCRPEEALDCFLRTKMDLLVLGRTIVEREPLTGS
jgi:predicted NodU family carbamoyl transferase